MLGRRAGSLLHVLALALPAAAPGLVVVAILTLHGSLAPRSALGAGVAILFLTAVVIGRFVLSAAALREAVEEIAAEAAEGAPRRPLALGPSEAADEMRLAVLRLARTWRERLQAARARSAASEAIVAAVPDPLILIDRQRRIVGANAAAADFVGAVSPPRDLATALRNPSVLAAADAVLRGEAARVVEFALTIPLERQLRARFARIAQPSPAQPLFGDAVALLTLHDVTELKRAEQMRADFIANASHELRTPLATLSGFIETLRGPAQGDAEAGERFLAIMAGQAARMTRLVEDLLSLSRIELNEHVPPQGRVALPTVLGYLAEALELRAGERDMRIRLDLPDDLPDVQGDRDELAQLFQNLLDNAIKYGRAGTEIAVTAEPQTRPAANGGQAPAGFVAVAVRDHGDGIAREHLPRLTERFYRVDTARSREMGGTGLGLAIVKHIVNRHRGILEIDSRLGEGSVFTVLLRRDAAGLPRAGSS
jgi:two-component system, OmpR family, phosphate regulon sensor histidine kinase PhoR